MKMDDINRYISTNLSGTTSLNNWKKSYKKCPHCGSQDTEVDTNCVLTTYPCQYSYHCKKCNEYFTSSDLLWVANDHIHHEPYLSQSYTPSYPTGWVCPKCGAVMSPTQNTCIYCTPAWTPTVAYGSEESIGGIGDPNITIKGTTFNENPTGTITLDEDYLKELLKNNKQEKQGRQGKEEVK